MFSPVYYQCLLRKVTEELRIKEAKQQSKNNHSVS